jgi:hypothetical protein
MSIRNNIIPFSCFNIIDRFSSDHRQEEQHWSIFDWQFIIPFGEPGIVP